MFTLWQINRKNHSVKNIVAAVEEQLHNLAVPHRDFYTPYRSFSDFSATMATPIYAPFLLGILSAAILAFVALASIVFVATVALTGGALLFNQKKLVEQTITFANMTRTFGIAAAVLAPSALMYTLEALPHAVAMLITRSTATLVEALSPQDREGASLLRNN